MEASALTDLVVITGFSGAGKSTAMAVFEDEGYFCVDNLPSEMIRSLVDLFMHAGSKVQHAGTISEDIPSAEAKQGAIIHAAESQGFKFVYQTAASPTTRCPIRPSGSSSSMSVSTGCLDSAANDSGSQVDSANTVEAKPPMIASMPIARRAPGPATWASAMLDGVLSARVEAMPRPAQHSR